MYIENTTAQIKQKNNRRKFRIENEVTSKIQCSEILHFLPH